MSIDALPTGFRQQGEKIHFLYIHTTVYIKKRICISLLVIESSLFKQVQYILKSEPYVHFLSDQAL